MNKTLLFAINVDWYFNLHWRERIFSEMTAGYCVHLCMSETSENNCWSGIDFSRLELSRATTGLLCNFKTLLSCIRVFLKVRPVAIHSVTVKPNIMFGLLAAMSRTPILITIPGLGTAFSADGRKAKFICRLLLFLYLIISKNKKAVFVFENRSDMALFRNSGICSNENSTVVPGAGVNIQRFEKKPVIRRKGEALLLLFAARLLKKKGLYELVRAVSELKDEGFSAILNVAGLIDCDTLDAIPISQVEKWHQEGRINWLGQVDDMETVISESHVIVLPTQYGEGIPRILLEANACGRPVIASKVPGCSDFVRNKKNGLLVEPGNNDDLKRAIKYMNDRDFCVKLGKNGRRLVENYYTDKHVIDCYRKIYNKLLT